MPDKREAEIYISLGHHKHGKTLLYRDLTDHQTCTEDQFGISPGTPGMVMVAFNMRLDNMVFKVIRDRFETPKRTSIDQIKQKYDLVFRHDRAGRLVDAQEFEALQFDRCCFTDELLDILTSEASAMVEVNKESVLLKHVYVQRRVTPLDLFLRTAAPGAAKAAVRDLGKAIKDLMAINIFPGDILLKNFGVTRHGRVVFYDYDEICHVTDCRFRKTPPPRDDMDLFQDEPWFLVEENDVFPEEFIRFMGLTTPLQKEFTAHHHDLLTPDLWQRMHRHLSRGKTYYVRPYADTYRLA
jgi:isocitrate dehydrogenase kinase/phosphatase